MLNLFVGVCALLSAVVQTAPTSPDSKSSRQLYEQAAKAIASADARAAIKPLEQLIDDQPSSSLACIAVVHLAECYIATNRANDAAALLEKWSERIVERSKAVKSDANFVAHHFRVWLQAAMRIEVDSEAIRSLEAVLPKLKSHDASDQNAAMLEVKSNTQVELARRLAAAGRFELAAEQIRELGESTSAGLNSEVQLLHAVVFQQIGDHAKAKSAFQSLVNQEQTSPSQWLAHLELATYAMQDRDYEAVARQLDPIIDTQPADRGFDQSVDCRFRLLRSELALLSGDAKLAWEVLPNDERIQELDEVQQVAVHFSRAEAAAQAGKVALALDDLQWLQAYAEKSTAKPSWSLTVAIRQCELLLKAKEYAKLNATAENAKKQFSSSERVHEFDYLLARAAMLQINFDEARAHLHAITSLNLAKSSSVIARAQWMLGETYFLEQNLTEAIAAYQPVTELAETQPWQTLALMQTGKCYELLNQSNAALAAYKQVVAVTADTKMREEASARIEVIERIAERTKPRSVR